MVACKIFVLEITNKPIYMEKNVRLEYLLVKLDKTLAL